LPSASKRTDYVGLIQNFEVSSSQWLRYHSKVTYFSCCCYTTEKWCNPKHKVSLAIVHDRQWCYFFLFEIPKPAIMGKVLESET
jgi:hypothetical protein